MPALPPIHGMCVEDLKATQGIVHAACALASTQEMVAAATHDKKRKLDGIKWNFALLLDLLDLHEK